ncbi:aureocin A53 family class IId bacteriocin [Microbacterium sp. SA39]|uniref:aureocin A53 family class IId bacteriocin n=1 Tax=Microbacterium sp. SA39 TaxID=1263625 RepID=UPI0005FA5351|nr:aureocin A53 family class IId bacteriocin [Microbacterium sp. SA39]KJQ52459.1 hypothetical protein RS85_03349 [Microbacterium sp. SA39]
MGPLLRFIAWLFTQIGRWSKKVLDAVAKWARDNWKRVVGCIERGVSFATIVQWILQILGLG